MAYIDDCREHYAHGFRTTTDEYAALRKSGYGQHMLAKLAAADAEEYEAQIDAREEDEYKCFLRGCLSVARQNAKIPAAA